MPELVFPVILQVVGIAVIIAEFVIPSAGLLTVAALGIFGYSLFHTYTEISAQAALWMAAADILMIPILIWVGVRIIANTPMALSGSLENRDENPFIQLVGKTGTVISTLRPAGKAIIDDKKYDVVSRGDFINAGEEVTVISAEGNRIVVIRAEKEKTDTE